MNRRERVLKTLEMEEPDRVPLTEVDIDMPLMEVITGKKFPVATSLQTQVIADRDMEERRVDLKIECYEKIGFDMFTVDLSAPEGWDHVVKPDGTMVDLWGRVMRLDKRSKAWVPYSTLFKTPEDFEEFNLPSPDRPGWAFATQHARKKLGEDVAIATFIRDPFAHAWEMFTPINFVKWMYTRPQFITRVLSELTEFNIGIIKRIAEADIDLIISGGDYCEAKGPMVPHKFFEDTIYPCLKKQVNASHKQGIKFVKHTDGNVHPLLEGLSEIVDGLHSLDPSAGVDIGAIKKEYKELVLMGNISVDNLAEKSRDDIIEETKNCIRKASPGGGHILSSSNSWAAGVRLENCMAMVKTARRYGKYPIKI